MRIRKGQKVEIRFLDHVKDGVTPLDCLVYGEVLKTAANSVVVMVWKCFGDDLPKPEDDPNVDTYTIVRSTILRARQLLTGQDLEY